jgi:hypothetical protein
LFVTLGPFRPDFERWTAAPLRAQGALPEMPDPGVQVALAPELQDVIGR